MFKAGQQLFQGIVLFTVFIIIKICRRSLENTLFWLVIMKGLHRNSGSGPGESCDPEAGPGESCDPEAGPG